MARLNVSLPDDLYEATKKWRDRMNLSEICARALKEELEAAEIDRTAKGLFSKLRTPTTLERSLMRRFDLHDARIAETPEDPQEIPEVLGEEAARYLDSRLCDGALLAVAGGRQVWRVVQNLSPRSIRVTLTALGVQNNDPNVLHVHPNTLTTFLWLLYSPGAQAKLVAANPFDSLWLGELTEKDRMSYFVVSSCGPFRKDSPFAKLIGEESTNDLLDRGATGDFAYIFFNERGELLDPPEYRVSPASGLNHSLLSAATIRSLCRRSDSCVLVIAGGQSKLVSLRNTLNNGLCNAVVTDRQTANELLR